MPKFKVLSSITADREYKRGDVIELTAKQAAAMPWAVEAMAEPEKAVEPEAKPEVESKSPATKKASK
jgi:hypothetical protein